MPFNVRNLDEFRKIINNIRRVHDISDERLLHLVYNEPGMTPPWDGEKPISRPALARFRGTKDNNIGNYPGLSVLWDVLEKHYPNEFPKQDGFVAEAPTENILAHALPLFFDEAPDWNNKLKSLRKRLVGKHIMYRKASYVGRRTGFFMASLMEIVETESSACVFEYQDHKKRDRNSKHEQKDGGFWFIVGKHACFLTKEISGDDCVKLGVIWKMWPSNKSRIADCFFGVLYVVSDTGIYPPARFFCERLADGQTFAFNEEMTLADIPNPRAQEFLGEEISMTIALGSAS